MRWRASFSRTLSSTTGCGLKEDLDTPEQHVTAASRAVDGKGCMTMAIPVVGLHSQQTPT